MAFTDCKGVQHLNLTEEVKFLHEIVTNGKYLLGNIADIVAEITDLPGYPEVHATRGLVYGVGTEAPYDYWIALDEWTQLGTFPQQGDDGEDGTDGANIWYCKQNGSISNMAVFPINKFENPTERTINVGDLVISKNGYLYSIYIVNVASVTAKYLLNVATIQPSYVYDVTADGNTLTFEKTDTTTVEYTPEINSIELDGDMTVDYDSSDGLTITYDGQIDGNTVAITERLPIRGYNGISIAPNYDNSMINLTVDELGLSLAGDGHAGLVVAGPNISSGFNTFAGIPMAVAFDYPTYSDKGGIAFIGKGTLETVLDNEVVRIDQYQTLTDAQKTQARENIDASKVIYYDAVTTSFPEGFDVYYNGAHVKNKEIYDRFSAGIQQVLRVTHPSPEDADEQETDICSLDDVRYNSTTGAYRFIFQTIRYYITLVRYVVGGAGTSNAYATNTTITLWGS